MILYLSLGTHKVKYQLPPKTLHVDLDNKGEDENDQEVIFINESEIIFEAQKEGSQLDENSNVIKKVSQK